MQSGGHVTRTLLMSKAEPGMLVVSRGSDGNYDVTAGVLDSGHSQIRAFNVSNFTATSNPYDYTTQGVRLGWGLRNSVGIAEEPLTGGIYSVENSADEMNRNGVDIHTNNPGEEMNFHGYLNNTEPRGNYGYPNCYALWSTDVPDLGNMTVGSQFALNQNASINDTYCSDDTIGPRLTFQAHTAPLDIIFQPNGSEAYVSFHGSWYLPSIPPISPH
jgi:glucose/arabinose dehydrogenase